MTIISTFRKTHVTSSILFVLINSNFICVLLDFVLRNITTWDLTTFGRLTEIVGIQGI